MTTDVNAPVRLRTGAEVPASAARATYIALDLLAKGEMADLMALYEARELAADPQHAMWPGTPERLKALAILDHGGKMHEIVRDVVLAAVEGGADVRLVWPFAVADVA